MLIEILSKPNCCLCDQVEFGLLRMVHNSGFDKNCDVRKVNIQDDPVLWPEYQWSIPVVRVNHDTVFHPDPKIDIPKISRFITNFLRNGK